MADSNRDTLYRNKHTSTSEKSRKALLIQGVRDEEQMLAALFPPEQWNVVVAPDNQTALEIATSDKFDLEPVTKPSPDSKSEGHLDLQVYVPGFQALTMQPFTFIPPE